MVVKPNEHGDIRAEAYMHLGITKKKHYLTAWGIKKGSDVSRFITAYRKGKKEMKLKDEYLEEYVYVRIKKSGRTGTIVDRSVRDGRYLYIVEMEDVWRNLREGCAVEYYRYDELEIIDNQK